MTATRQEQFEFEIKHDSEAASRRLRELREAAAKGDVSLPRASRLIGRMYGEVAEFLDRVRNTTTRGAGGKYKRWLRALPLDLAAVIAVRRCIQICYTHTSGASMQQLAADIGKHWELEVRIREAEKVNAPYVQKVHEQLKRNASKNERHIRNVYNTVYDRVMKGEIEHALTNTDMIQIGKFGVQACYAAGLLSSHRAPFQGGLMVLYSVTDSAKDFLSGYGSDDVKFVTDRRAGAMLREPDDWSTVHDGGYISSRRKYVAPLISVGRRMRPHWKQYLRDEVTDEKCPEVFRVANYLQSRAFRVHKPTLEAIRRVWEAGGGALGVPRRQAPVKPVCPLPEDWSKHEGTQHELEVFREWKRQAVLYYLEHRDWQVRVRELSEFLYSAALHDRPVWFPVHMDTRGRWYYRGSPNPQGSDLSKGVLHFEHKKPLGRDGVFWLKVHIANSLGVDKDRFVDRARYVEQHWDALERAVTAPEDFPDVWGTDAPWAAFSAVYELSEAYKTGCPEKYESGAIVHMDATCSGLQHFSAMLRDPVGGRYVNLFDEAKCGPKQDIYTQVAANSLAAVRNEITSTEKEVAAMAKWWSEVGVPRDLAKKPV